MRETYPERQAQPGHPLKRSLIRAISRLMLGVLIILVTSAVEAQRPSTQLQSPKWEREFRSIPEAPRLREYVRRLSAEPHPVGSPAGKAAAEWMRDQLRGWGLEATIEEFDVLFPTPHERVVEMLSPQRFRAQLQEPPLAEDPDSADRDQLPTYHAYSGDGDVTAPLVYVNYGVPADYEELARRGIEVRGKIVLARYGGSWRGIKPKVAAEHGAIGCLIYSDPREDGYYQGPVYPEGPYRNEHGVQRGSVMDMPIHPGDPLTPGWGSVPGARRLPREEAQTLMKIPVLPLSYGDALPLLRSLEGPVAPESWRGALPVTYRIGPGKTTVRLKVLSDWRTVRAYNVIARIRGEVYPDEWILRGNHHDAWVNGADDPVSGMATVLEEARAMGVLLQRGWRPKRTIIYCAWDAEEPGLLGSTEWVEQHAAELREKAVAYINTDSTGKGWFSAGGSHSLERLVNDVARTVRMPGGETTLWQAMQNRRLAGSRSETERRALLAQGDIPISALGSGSDYTAFLDHLGIASLNIGMGGESGGGIYHSIYDTFTWYTRFSDSTFEYGQALTQAAGTLTLRLADASVLPFDFTRSAQTIAGYLSEIEQLPRQGVELRGLRKSVEALQESAREYELALAQAVSSGAIPQEQTKKARELNRLLYQSERRLISDRGLPRRSWFRHLIYAPGLYTGYGVKTLPGVREAIEQRNWEEATREVAELQTTLDGLADQVRSAAHRLSSPE
jgi:N-acetylated-alpha-linked acidic dipeptidase